MIRGIVITGEEFALVLTTAPVRASYREIELARGVPVPQLPEGHPQKNQGRLVLIPVADWSLSLHLGRWESFGNVFVDTSPENENPALTYTEVIRLLFEKLISKEDQ